MSVDYRRLRFRDRLVLPERVLVLMSWCKQNGYSCLVSFGRNRITEVKIRKMRE